MSSRFRRFKPIAFFGVRDAVRQLVLPFHAETQIVYLPADTAVWRRMPIMPYDTGPEDLKTRRPLHSLTYM
jgi:hypothetical protein